MSGRSDEHVDDSGYGPLMVATFATAALVVTGAVALLALVGSWWMLGVVFGVHVLMTGLITFAVIHAFADGHVETTGRRFEAPRDAVRRPSRGPSAAVAAHR